MKRSNEFNHSHHNTIETNVEPINRTKVLAQLAEWAILYRTLLDAAAEDDCESLHDLARMRREMQIAQFCLDHSPEAQAA